MKKRVLIIALLVVPMGITIAWYGEKPRSHTIVTSGPNAESYAEVPDILPAQITTCRPTTKVYTKVSESAPLGTEKVPDINPRTYKMEKIK